MIKEVANSEEESGGTVWRAIWARIGKKHRINSHSPTSEGVSERANRQASGPVLQSVFLAILAHSAERERVKGQYGGRGEGGKRER